MRTSILWAILPVVVSACSPSAVQGPVAGLSDVASMLASVSSSAASYKQAQATIALNGANQHLVEAQAAMTRSQVEQTLDDQARLSKERLVTAGLLRVMSTEYHDPLFELLAKWVEAGGDPDFAFKYALSRADQETAHEQPVQTLSLAQRPELSPTVSTDGSSQHSRLSPDKSVSESHQKELRPPSDGNN